MDIFIPVWSALSVFIVGAAVALAIAEVRAHAATKARHKEELEFLRKRDRRRYQTLLDLCNSQVTLKYNMLNLVEEMEKDDIEGNTSKGA